ncbi:patatin-like phospholipase family protein [Methylobacterium nigriterrae]|uniref:patatin-like phospholipase family protein n=1 Tax=Methylobacterium nigriterrae TaxID=3127512 RepID=UPI00301362BC
MPGADTPRVAIACQGGGSHAAFAAGILSHLLRPEIFDRFALIALSGTSGGAVCAALAWSGLIARDGGPAEAASRLLAFWRELEADDPVDGAINAWGTLLAGLPVTAEVSPYLIDVGAAARLRLLLARHVRLEALPPAGARPALPKLLVGATDIRAGEGRILCGETLTYDDLVASAAVPPLFRAVRTRGTWLWDGLFSRNPPIRALTDLPEKPDEIWVIQINPQGRASEPTTMPEIIDRRNELAGNLSLDRELDFIETINDLIERHPAIAEAEGYRRIAVRVVALDLDLDYPSKLDRSPELIERLLSHGAAKAHGLFEPASLRGRAPKGLCWTGAG